MQYFETISELFPDLHLETKTKAVYSIQKLKDLFDNKAKPLKYVLQNLMDLRDRSSYPARFDSYETTEHRAKLSKTDLLGNVLMLKSATQEAKLSKLGYPFNRQGNLVAVSSSSDGSITMLLSELYYYFPLF